MTEPQARGRAGAVGIRKCRNKTSANASTFSQSWHKRTGGRFSLNGCIQQLLHRPNSMLQLLMTISGFMLPHLLQRQRPSKQFVPAELVPLDWQWGHNCKAPQTPGWDIKDPAEGWLPSVWEQRGSGRWRSHQWRSCWYHVASLTQAALLGKWKRGARNWKVQSPCNLIGTMKYLRGKPTQTFTVYSHCSSRVAAAEPKRLVARDLSLNDDFLSISAKQWINKNIYIYII